MNSQQSPNTILAKRHQATNQFLFDFTGHEHLLSEDVCVSLFDGNTEILHVWFNTNFVDETGILIFNRDDIDFVNNDKDYSSAFSMEVELKELDEDIEDILREASELYYDPYFNDY